MKSIPSKARICVLCCSILFAGRSALFAREPTDLSAQVRSLAPGQSSPPATIEVVRWLEGDWEGELEGNAQQNMIYAPVAGHMPGFVRAWTKEGKNLFYEIAVFVESGGSVEYRGKHFTPELSGWEGKDEFYRRPLVAITDSAVYFDGITFVKDGPDRHTVYFRLPSGERKGQIIVVHQRRIITRNESHR